ncbi:hypothetical protein MTR67_052429, partial [Solanum verrucosum]
VGIVNQLVDPPFGQFHCLFSLAFSILKFYNFGRSNSASWNRSVTRQLLLSLADLIFSFRASHTRTLGEVLATQRFSHWIRRSTGLIFFVLSTSLFLFAR